MKQDNRRAILLSIGVVGFLVVVGLVGLVTYFMLNRGNDGDNLDVVAERPTPTLTSTPVPSPTPTNTPTPLPTETPTPAPTATPLPLSLTITGPKFIPRGLPIQVEWRFVPTDGSGVAIVSLEDLGGSMAIGDEAGNVVIARTVATETEGDSSLVNYDSEFVISAIIDPNVNQGIASFLIDNNLVSESISIPWIANNGTEIETQTFTITLDGVEESTLLDATEEIEEVAETVVEVTAGESEGFLLYRTRDDLQFEYPADWFVSEFPDGTTQVSEEQIGAVDGASAPETSYALILSGTQEQIGLPESVEPTNAAILEWLIGNVNTSGGGENSASLPVVTESGMEIVSEYELIQSNGETMSVVELISGGTEEEEPFKAFFAVNATEANIIIVNGLATFDPENPNLQITIFNQIAESISILETEAASS
ncbi:MAG: hypothetical protein AAF633_07080 [Chloroflexota bacterium]